MIQSRRSAEAAKRSVGRLVATYGEPRVVITGKLRNYIKPTKAIAPGADHARYTAIALRQMGKLSHRVCYGVSISFGYATVGIVGSAGRFEYTASGTSINMAARLCDVATHIEILISAQAWAVIESVVEAVSQGEVEMNGIREKVEVFAVVSE